MTDAKNEWVAEMPAPIPGSLECVDGPTGFRYSVEARVYSQQQMMHVVTKCNTELTAARARIAELEKERDAAKALAAEMEERWSHSIYQAADDEQKISLLQNYVDTADSDGWAPVSREAMSGETVRIRFRNGLHTGEAIARYDIDYGEYGVIEWEGWHVDELDCEAEVFAFRPLSTIKVAT